MKPSPLVIAHKAPIEERISVMLREIEAFVLSRAKEIRGDLPLESVLMMLQAGNCPCRTVFKIAETRERDAAIAAEQAIKERHARRSETAS
jgi:hypothetical protein